MIKIVKCLECGKIAIIVKDSPCPTKCCGEPMVELTANTTDAALEKHIPVIEQEGNLVKVTVAEVEHPMLEAHYIEWILLETTHGTSIKYLKPGETPVAYFALAEGEEVIAAYEHCNLHGLWKKEA